MVDDAQGGATAGEQASRARTASKQAEPHVETPALQAGSHRDTAPSFDDIVAVVERASGTGLTGPTREFCRHEYERYPQGVAMCANEAAVRPGVRTPNGLFVRMLKDRDHVRHEAAWDSVRTTDDDEPSEISNGPAESTDEAARTGLEMLGKALGVETDGLLRHVDQEQA